MLSMARSLEIMGRRATAPWCLYGIVGFWQN
jgi:hypothetical protein